MNQVAFALGANVVAFLGTFITFIYKQGKTEGKLDQIDKRIDRIEDILNQKED